ncbi:acyl-CoA thioesterase II [Microbulbifer thermotolerans]|uniref:Acyl-CoA thioesterase 2 n=1 Tax=Microbulbifer thermotolerans TaxID=252514 RepID=A0AB35HSZ8_MICTH|nr:acyl-CoA thioesterase II [Microbulbifer thermotolerans]MCX2782319.1 acyl-CoA thioesterase II [Microbulbifer thermotolerans]MCX2800472.1 acyl-CoA thioesterase II [Microbulbifer thermotolerans]MCX2831096.1 acyl-CoA thioesterase II [Microbulbifer thermotolerans]
MLDKLSKLLDVEELDHNLFRSRHHVENYRKILFGGQVLGQALMAASRTVKDRLPHSLHAYFLRPGSSELPVIYDVDPIRDGGSFTTRRVVAKQRGRAIFNMSASFQIEEPGFDHQAAMPSGDIPEPERLKNTQQLAAEAGLPTVQHDQRRYMVDFRPVDPHSYFNSEAREARCMFWFRVEGEMSDDPLEHRCALSYASDIALLGTSLQPHPMSLFDPHLMPASLDHAMWFHRKFRADNWLLYVTDSPSASGARGFCRGQIFTREGVLVASTAQEGLIRQIKK